MYKRLKRLEKFEDQLKKQKSTKPKLLGSSGQSNYGNGQGSGVGVEEN